MNTVLKILVIALVAMLIFAIIDHESRNLTCRNAGGMYVQGLCFKPDALLRH